MADRDHDWGQRGRHGQHDRWERDQEHRRAERDRPWENRSFGQQGRFEAARDRYGPGSRGRRFEGGEPWLGEGRWSSRYDQDRAGYRNTAEEAPRFGGYGGQEYGIEGGREHYERGQGGGADYAFHPAQPDELDAEYLSWRDQQMRRHDRDYQAWRKARQQRYDDDYRMSREHRRGQDGHRSRREET